MKKILTILLLLSISSVIFATKYYIKNGGNDLNTGLSDDQAWATLGKITTFQSQTGFSIGDTISLKCGSIWRESLVVPRSGNASTYFVINSYGTGDRPSIIGSTQAITWTESGTANIWQSATSLTSNPYVTIGCEIFITELDDSIKWGVYKAYTSGFTNLIQEYDWTWNSNTLYVYAISDPDSRYSKIEAPQRTTCIQYNDKEYITIDSIEISNTKYGIFGEYPTLGHTGSIIKNCKIHHTGSKNGAGYGTYVVYNNSLFANNIVYEMGRRAFSLYNYGSSNISKIIIEENEFYNGYHNSGPDAVAGSTASSTGNMDSIIVRRNYFHLNDQYEESVNYEPDLSWFQGPQDGTGIVTGLYIYCNIFKNTYDCAIGMEQINEAFIYNNTFHGMNKLKTLNSFHIKLTQACQNIAIKNNIFYNDADYDVNTSAISVNLSSLDSYSEVDANYNLYYTTDSRLPIISKTGTASYTMSQWGAMKAATGWETNSPSPADPLFVSTSNYNLQAVSPAIGTGIGVGLTKDYAGNAWNATPSIGAYEYNSTPPTPTDLPVCSFSSEVGWYSNLKSISVTIMGGWTDDGGGTITDAGIVISTSANPTISDRKISFNDMIASSGYFNETITGLKGNTTYHMRIFATNESGTAYSADQTLTTNVYNVLMNNGKVLMYNGKVVIIK